MTDTEIKLWQWFQRQGPKTVDAVFETAAINRSKFFGKVAAMRHQLEKTGRRKAQSLTSDLEKIHELRFDRMKSLHKKKKARKANAIELRYYVIKKLRNEGGSWADIRAYLKRYHRLDISRDYLHRIWKELVLKYEGEGDVG